jgi:hypothetical protein
MNVGETFLDDAKNCQFDLVGDSAEAFIDVEVNN